jgi:thiamine pyrophosphate-dependent acetolactate synthase large subunit-like protein
MPKESFRMGVVAKTKRPGTLDRREAVPKLVGEPKDFLIITGVGGAKGDTAQLCGPDADFYAAASAMGSATMVGLGLALAQPGRKVLVITGDGELLMNVGSLATVSVMNPPNLSILCIDNGHYWETGGQTCHTAIGTDLAVMAAGAGIGTVKTVTQESEFSEAASILRANKGPAFVLLKVKPGNPPKVRSVKDTAWIRQSFRYAIAAPKDTFA